LIFNSDKEINLFFAFFSVPANLAIYGWFSLFYLPNEESSQIVFLKYKPDL